VSNTATDAVKFILDRLICAAIVRMNCNVVNRVIVFRVNSFIDYYYYSDSQPSREYDGKLFLLHVFVCFRSLIIFSLYLYTCMPTFFVYANTRYRLSARLFNLSDFSRPSPRTTWPKYDNLSLSVFRSSMMSLAISYNTEKSNDIVH